MEGYKALLNHIPPETIFRGVALTICVYIAVLVAVSIDLISGLRRSQRLGIRVKSKGIRSSVRKFNDYILLIVLATIADILLCGFKVYDLPYITLIFGVVAIANEVKSVWENTDKDRQKDIAKAVNGLAELARTKGEAEEIIKVLQSKMDGKE